MITPRMAFLMVAVYASAVTALLLTAAGVIR